MVAAIALMVLSLATIGVGRGVVRTARRMRTYGVTRGRVVKRELALVGGDNREGRWGTGGGYRPKVTYTYEVDGTSYTGDRGSYVHRGLKKRLAEEALAAIPDDVEVFYDPDAPGEAYLEKHRPRFGWILVAAGSLGVFIALVLLAGG
jgi:hypothetical protein